MRTIIILLLLTSIAYAMPSVPTPDLTRDEYILPMRLIVKFGLLPAPSDEPEHLLILGEDGNWYSMVDIIEALIDYIDRQTRHRFYWQEAL